MKNRELKFRVWDTKNKEFINLVNFWVSPKNLNTCFMEWQPELDGETVFETKSDTLVFQQYIELKKQIAKLQEMFDMQVKLVTALELEKIELRNIIESLTKGKLPCNPDHNGECLVCDNWLSDCPLNKK